MQKSLKNEPAKASRKPGETLQDKIHRHLSDKNDIITEEDIRDIVIDKEITLTPPTPSPKKKSK